MAVISSSLVNIALPSGHRAVYEVEPRHMQSGNVRDSALAHGKQIAHQLGHRWYHAGGWEEIKNLRTIALIERASEF